MARSFSFVFRGLSPVGRMGWLRSCLGALAGIVITGTLCRMWLGGEEGLPFLVAPIGASAVLLFAVPASPLAQPWSIVGGNTVSALAGVLGATLMPDPILGGGLAVALAIAAMSLLRCLHPPGGAVALTAAIGGPAIAAAGWSFALVPVGVNSAMLLLLGWLFNNATRHGYPHRAASVTRSVTADPPAQDRVGYTAADIDAVLARYDELLDVSRDDLDALFRQVEARAFRRLHGEIRCERVMSRDIITVSPDSAIADARMLLQAKGFWVLPVVQDGRAVGLVGALDLLGSSAASVSDVMDGSPCIASMHAPIDQLLPILSGGRYHAALITDAEGLLAGIVTQTDLLAALWRGQLAEQIVASKID
jgi:CBS domain-containing membrane protein